MKIFVLKDKEFSTEQAIRKCLKKDVEISRTEYGKPIVSSDIFVGVTHTNGLLFIGVWDKNFGIDAEYSKREVKNKDLIISKYYSEYEKNKNFLDVWVKKEAYLKFLGTGLKDLKKADTDNKEFCKVEYSDYIIYIYADSKVDKVITEELF